MIINELKQYIHDPDPNFVEKSVKMIGEICLKFADSYSKFFIIYRCVDLFLNLITNKNSSYNKAIDEIAY